MDVDPYWAERLQSWLHAHPEIRQELLLGSAVSERAYRQGADRPRRGRRRAPCNLPDRRSADRIKSLERFLYRQGRGFSGPAKLRRNRDRPRRSPGPGGPVREAPRQERRASGRERCPDRSAVRRTAVSAATRSRSAAARQAQAATPAREPPEAVDRRRGPRLRRPIDAAIAAIHPPAPHAPRR